jgi:hypothetical protein
MGSIPLNGSSNKMKSGIVAKLAGYFHAPAFPPVRELPRRVAISARPNSSMR